MSLGLVGRKVGMTRVFTDDGDAIPVTVVDVSNNRVTQIRTPDTDGYAAVQVTFGKRRARRVNKAAAGHFAKAGVEAGHTLKEFRVTPGQLDVCLDAVASSHPAHTRQTCGLEHRGHLRICAGCLIRGGGRAWCAPSEQLRPKTQVNVPSAKAAARLGGRRTPLRTPARGPRRRTQSRGRAGRGGPSCRPCSCSARGGLQRSRPVRPGRPRRKNSETSVGIR